MKKLEYQQGLLDEPTDLDESDFLESIARTIFRKGGGLLGALLNPKETGSDQGYIDDQGRLVVTDPLIRESNFRHWFGDSKVVDEEGNPLVVYHGSGNGKIESFLPKNRDGSPDIDAPVLKSFRKAQKEGKPFGYMDFRSGSFFSPDPEYARNYTNEDRGVIYPVYIKAKNPIYISQKKGGKPYYMPDKTRPPDAVILTDGDKIGDTINEVIVIEPNQIKSIHNRGTYNPDDPDLLGMNTMNMSLLYG